MARTGLNAVPRRIAYLGPAGTFSEQALLSEQDLASGTLIAVDTIGDAIAGIAAAEVDAAFVPIENSIEGSVNVTIDELIFGNHLFIQREVVLEVHLELMGIAGADKKNIKTVMSFSHAVGQCRQYLSANFPGVHVEVTNSTADAARLVAERGSIELAAIAPSLSAELYGLEILDHAIEDHDGNETRFVLVALNAVPRPTGHDRTTIVCFQHADHPGSLHQILGQFAARSLNLTRIESRPTKRGLGDYCFVIEFEGHLDNEVVGDTLVSLHTELDSMKFLGSYPVSGDAAAARRDDHEQQRKAADTWLASLREHIVEN